MRPGAGFNGTAVAAPVSGVGGHSAWHSPVPYLFGGLAAMLGLIAFALLILACSYWKLSGYLDSGSAGGRGDGGDAGSEGKPAAAAAAPATTFYEEKIVVIMAGEDKPTCLATPKLSRASLFGDNNKAKDEEEKRSGDSVQIQNKTQNEPQNQSRSEDQTLDPEQ